MSIKIDDCKDGYLYIIRARNASIGIWNQKELGFIISRTKFGSNFLFIEYHYDIGEKRPEDTCFGTATPIKELHQTPEMTDEETLKYLNIQREIYKELCSSEISLDIIKRKSDE